MSNFESVEVMGLEHADEQNPLNSHDFIVMLNTLRHDTSNACAPKLMSLLQSEIYSAYTLKNHFSLHLLNYALNELLSQRFQLIQTPEDCSPVLFQIQQSIIDAQFKSDQRAISSVNLPSTFRAFEQWIVDRFASTTVSPHPLFQFLALGANVAQFRHFISVEAAVHVAFDDVIAMTQIGVRGMDKLEFFDNFQDELGSHDPDRFHLTLFGNLITQLGITHISKSRVPWQALVCGNYMMFLSYFRSSYRYCIGYLGYLETTTPARFKHIAQAGLRLGLPRAALAYHLEHAEIDAQHAEAWLRNIIIPEAQRGQAETLRAIATGVLLRERVANRYWDTLLSLYQACTDPEVSP